MLWVVSVEGSLSVYFIPGSCSCIYLDRNPECERDREREKENTCIQKCYIKLNKYNQLPSQQYSLHSDISLIDVVRAKQMENCSTSHAHTHTQYNGIRHRYNVNQKCNRKRSSSLSLSYVQCTSCTQMYTNRHSHQINSNLLENEMYAFQWNWKREREKKKVLFIIFKGDWIFFHKLLIQNAIVSEVVGNIQLKYSKLYPRRMISRISISFVSFSFWHCILLALRSK